MITIIVPDQYTNIQSAINAIPVGEQGEVYIKEGTYILPRISGQTYQVLARTKIKIRGDGIGRTILKRNSVVGENSDLNMIGSPTNIPVEDFIIENLTLDGNYTTLYY